MFVNLQPMLREELLAALAEEHNQEAFSIQAYPEWFDEFLADDPVLSGYPFHLGLWARDLSSDIAKVLGKEYFRLNLVFTYVVGNRYYRGIIAYDTPMKMDISVRVTEQRHLKIKPDTVVLASVVNDTEFATWRPEMDIQGSGKWRWMIQKEMSTRNYRPSQAFCPTDLRSVPNAVAGMLVHCASEFFKAEYGQEHVEPDMDVYLKNTHNRARKELALIMGTYISSISTPIAVAQAYSKLWEVLCKMSEMHGEKGPKNVLAYEEKLSTFVNDFYGTIATYIEMAQPYSRSRGA